MSTFVKGITFGLGFGLGLLMIALVVINYPFIISSCYDDGSDDTIVGTDAITINEHRLEVVDGKPMIYGSLTNSTDKQLSSVMIEGSIYNEDGRFLDKNDDYFASLPPKETFGFKIGFYDWKDRQLGNNLTHEVRIAQGFDRE